MGEGATTTPGWLTPWMSQTRRVPLVKWNVQWLKAPADSNLKKRGTPLPLRKDEGGQWSTPLHLPTSRDSHRKVLTTTG